MVRLVSPVNGNDRPTDTSSRRTRTELRSLLLDTGIDVLLEFGLGSGAEHVTFKRVFERLAATSGVRVTNASVIGRIWENQAEFQSAVLVAVASLQITDQEQAVSDATADLLSAVDRSTMESRRAGLRELVRLTAEANMATSESSRSWATVIGVWALVSGSRAPGSEVIHEAMRRSYESIGERNRANISMLMDFFGMRLRPPFEVEQFLQSTMALVEGCALRDRPEAELPEIRLPTGPDGSTQRWTLLGVAMDGLIDQFFETDPDWSPDSSR